MPLTATITPPTSRTAIRILLPFARSQPLNAVRYRVVAPGATMCTSRGSHTRSALITTTTTMAVVVSSMSALAVAIT